MKFAIGYPLRQPACGFFACVEPLKHAVAELYFPWPGFASGRSSLGENGGYTDYTAQARLEEDLWAFRDAGIGLDLLLNANCYGEGALSLALEKKICSVLGYMAETVGLPEVVTTASPAIAHMLRQAYPTVRVRASVNMRVGTVEGMAYLSDLFDEYVVQRDYNRDLSRLALLREWAAAHGKGLSMLANSGCLRFCPGQTFHDNLVAHGTGVDQMANLPDFQAHTCRRYLKGHPEHFPAVMQATWVRPEDLHRYADLFDTVKLATRMHPAPWAVLAAYASARWDGNLLDLLEPGLSDTFSPQALDNRRIPNNWFDAALQCDKQCHRCNICASALTQALVPAQAPSPS